VDAAERSRVIDRAIAELKAYYIYPDVGQKMADALLAHESSGDDDAETDGAAFADLLTTQMREVSHDRHLGVDGRPEGIPADLTGPTAEETSALSQRYEAGELHVGKSDDPCTKHRLREVRRIS
jgi:hypothetical protein